MYVCIYVYLYVLFFCMYVFIKKMINYNDSIVDTSEIFWKFLYILNTNFSHDDIQLTDEYQFFGNAIQEKKIFFMTHTSIHTKFIENLQKIFYLDIHIDDKGVYFQDINKYFEQMILIYEICNLDENTLLYLRHVKNLIVQQIEVQDMLENLSL